MSFSISRNNVITSVIRELKSKMPLSQSQYQYAFKENITFFEASKNIISYIKWLLLKAPKIHGDSLYEINDLISEYDAIMHQTLINKESKFFPGLVKPLINTLENIVFNSQRDSNELKFLNIGSGGMEVERQLCKLILEKGNLLNKKYYFIGVDKSIEAQKVARKNLSSVSNKIIFIENDHIDQSYIDDLIKNTTNGIYVILSKNNIFEIDKCFSLKYFDVAFHSLFFHHITNIQDRLYLDKLSCNISKIFIEYDGYRNLILNVPISLTAWKEPIFLNAAIFSNLRYLRKEQILNKMNDREIIKFYNIGYYLKQRIN